MLTLKNISKSFLQRGIVLKNLDLTVREGDSVSIMGPSGSGKTTLLNIIGLLDRPDSGEVTFKGEPVLKYNQDESALYRNRNIGFVFQDHLLLPYLTVMENILLPLLASGAAEEDHRIKEDDAKKMMERTGITDIAGKYPYQISGGEAQRATLVRALVNKPSILLADEPTGSLDRKNSENLGDLLTGMNKDYGITLILATHSQDLAGRMKIRYNLSEGKLVDGINR
ncbi:MAG: ABC transporter ATP-binding protein [Bacteroidales bacterium]|jgi:ABC-type lipoprotein export system ATPase subunit|nr:ABC transporter ATP-binding protein [Bacteroidales bacterium]